MRPQPARAAIPHVRVTASPGGRPSADLRGRDPCSLQVIRLAAKPHPLDATTIRRTSRAKWRRETFLVPGAQALPHGDSASLDLHLRTARLFNCGTSNGDRQLNSSFSIYRPSEPPGGLPRRRCHRPRGRPAAAHEYGTARAGVVICDFRECRPASAPAGRRSSPFTPWHVVFGDGASRIFRTRHMGGEASPWSWWAHHLFDTEAESRPGGSRARN